MLLNNAYEEKYIIENCKIFFQNHYKTSNYELRIVDSNKETLYAINNKYGAFSPTLNFSNLLKVLVTDLFYDKIFLKYNQLQTMNVYMQNKFDLECICQKSSTTQLCSFILLNKHKYEIKDSQCTSFEKFILYLRKNYKYSLSKVIPYICPNCKENFLKNDFSYPLNVEHLQCECGYFIEEVL